MRGAGYGLAVLGVVVVLFGALNHWELRMNPVHHFSTVLGATGAVIAVVGLILTFVGGNKAAS
jgi:hypothetical protein